jgi:1-deoxy-D-xylulose-5-phosphate synthase
MAKTFSNIPLDRPETPLLDSISDPSDLRGLTSDQLLLLADELRIYLLFSVGQSGGHFGAGLGAINYRSSLCLQYTR